MKLIKAIHDLKLNENTYVKINDNGTCVMRKSLNISDYLELNPDSRLEIFVDEDEEIKRTLYLVKSQDKASLLSVKATRYKTGDISIALYRVLKRYNLPTNVEIGFDFFIDNNLKGFKLMWDKNIIKTPK